MRRVLAIALILLAAGLLIVIPGATGADDGPYKVRAIFDNGGFIVKGEEVRVAGATIGTVESVDVSGDDEIVSLEGGPHAVPGKAVVVLNIDDDAFKDFRQDASCIIRPQSLIGEKLVDCTPTQPHAPSSEPPPELDQIEDGPGMGQRLLPLENNGKAVDLDLIQNINRASYRDRFRLILNDLGAGLAARGDDLGAIVDRANPALRQTNRVLKILADQSDQLDSLATDSDAVLEPLARNRASVTGFLHNAAVAGEATAERKVDLEAQLEKFPETLRQLRATMKDLRGFADQGTPLAEDAGASAPYLSKATQHLPAFFKAGIPAFVTLGDASEASGPKLVASDPVIVQTRELTKKSSPTSQDLSALLSTFNDTGGFQHLMDFIYNSVGNINGYDTYGHFQRALGQRSNCTDIAAVVFPSCEAFFVHSASSKNTKKKKKKKSKASIAAAGARPRLESPPSEAVPLPPIEELIPELDPEAPDEDQPTVPNDPAAGEPGAAAGDGAGKAETGSSSRSGGATDETMRDASLLLQFLLGGGA